MILTRKATRSGLLLLAVGALVGLAPLVADARAPQRTSAISEVRPTLEPTYDHPEAERATLYVGKGQCEALVRDNPELRVVFETTTLNLRSDDFVGGVYRYDQERGASTQVNCDRSERCIRLSDERYEREERRITARIPFREFSGLNSAADCESEVDENRYVQVLVRTAAGGDWSVAEARVLIDLVRPEPPELLDAFATEYSVRVELEPSASDDARASFLVYSSSPIEADTLPTASGLTIRPLEMVGSDRGTASGLSLEGGAELYIGLAARDHAGNYSFVSEAQQVRVARTQTFWDLYREAGGAEEGGYGCQATGQGGAPSPLFFVVLLGLVAFFLRSAVGKPERAPAKVGRK